MFQDDELPKPRKSHEIGCDLTFLSAAELDERIAALKEEIARLEADKAAKTSSRAAAESFFVRNICGMTVAYGFLLQC